MNDLSIPQTLTHNTSGFAPCYQTHQQLVFGQYSIFGGNAFQPVIRDADVYVSLDEKSSWGVAADRWNIKDCDHPLDLEKANIGFIEILYAIPDMGIPGNVEKFKYLISWICNELQAGKRIHVGCIGGHGRTGMVLAAIVARLGKDRHAISYVRKHYCERAVESEAQVNFLIRHFGILRPEVDPPCILTSRAGDNDHDACGPSYSSHDDELTLCQQQFGPLHKRGSGFLARCPLHDDHHPSMNIDKKEGRWLWYCFVCQRGGTIDQLLKRSPRRSHTEDSSSTTPISRDDVVVTYPYRDAAGTLAFEVLRFESVDTEGNRKKTFRLRRPDGGGGWSWKVSGAHRTLYNLPRVLGASTVVICEGEKDCDTAMSLGYVSTCNPIGAGKWEDRYSEFLRDKDVVIIPDKDEAGRNHARQVFTSLKSHARSVKMIELPTGKDITEWVEQGGTSESLENLIRLAPFEDLTATTAIVDTGTTTFARTDTGNAERFAKHHGDGVRFCHVTGNWYLWNGIRWGRDETGRVHMLAKETVRKIHTDALALADDEQRRLLIKHALQSESEPRINAMLHLAQNETNIPIRLQEMDRDPLLLNVTNGTIDLRNGQLREHRREDLITKLSPVDYDPDAECPLFLQFLADVTSGNSELLQYLQRAIGYSLTGDVDEHALFMLYGTGANGKSTLLEIFRFMLGDYAQTADFNSFVASTRSSGPRNDLAKLQGARFVTATESEDGVRLAESFVKQITGGDTITARFLYSEHFEFRPQFKLWVGTNHKPDIRGTDEGVWRRIRLVPFTAQISDEKRDLKLSQKLKGEAFGILNWALEGLAQYHVHGLREPTVVCTATAEYREDQDVRRRFINFCCTIRTDAMVHARTLYTAYRDWAVTTGEVLLSERQFFKGFADPQFAKVRQNRGFVWKGIGLTERPHSDGQEEGAPCTECRKCRSYP